MWLWIGHHSLSVMCLSIQEDPLGIFHVVMDRTLQPKCDVPKYPSCLVQLVQDTIWYEPGAHVCQVHMFTRCAHVYQVHKLVGS